MIPISNGLPEAHRAANGATPRRDVHAAPTPPGSMALLVRFAALAIAEALARRSVGAGGDASYSPAAEISHLVADLSAALEPTQVGLEPGGKASLARAALDLHLLHHPGEPLARVERGLGLDDIERDLLRILLAFSLDPRIGLLIGHVHDALQRVRPTHGALAEILRAPVAVALALDPARPLRRALVVELDRHGPDGVLAIDPRIVTYVASAALSPLYSAAGRLTLTLPGDLPRASVAAAHRIDLHASIVVHGPGGAGRHSAARALAAREGRPLLRLELGAGDTSQVVACALRDARILGARLAVAGPLDKPCALELAAAFDVPLALLLDEAAALPEPLLARPLLPLALRAPTAAERAEIWRDALGGAIPEGEIAAAAERYAFTPGRILRAAALAPSLGIEAACRAQIRHSLDGVAVRRDPAATGWDRLVLPPATLDALRAVSRQIAQRARVGQAWGFERHHALGHGTKALFYGRPGTGKTLAADVLASELGMPLYRVDLSRIVSKWVGETEQNLGRIFDESRQSYGILFFDEADSLFSRRTAVQSSTDRYANMEVNYLLQKIDEHDGVIILATNLKAHMDEAFSRRLHHVVEFAEPDALAREQIWRLSIPKEAPVDAELDFAQLAERFEISGGAIRNVVLGAAYHAAAAGSPIHMAHIAGALRAEYAKMDRLCPRAEFDGLTSLG
ncbi:ATP-binding protein [Sorangium sp. So ce117]|uniref:ATP-binding protein n=1 Tax=Sorangium sp. So ce117 TaxID=3133277 RepID=UPI003F5F40D6